MNPIPGAKRLFMNPNPGAESLPPKTMKWIPYRHASGMPESRTSRDSNPSDAARASSRPPSETSRNPAAACSSKPGGWSNFYYAFFFFLIALKPRVE